MSKDHKWSPTAEDFYAFHRRVQINDDMDLEEDNTLTLNGNQDGHLRQSNSREVNYNMALNGGNGIHGVENGARIVETGRTGSLKQDRRNDEISIVNQGQHQSSGQFLHNFTQFQRNQWSQYWIRCGGIDILTKWSAFITDGSTLTSKYDDDSTAVDRIERRSSYHVMIHHLSHSIGKFNGKSRLMEARLWLDQLETTTRIHTWPAGLNFRGAARSWFATKKHCFHTRLEFRTAYKKTFIP